ncbi:MAG: lamin tail domain-containing protein, partial [Myxococcota bacterium]
VTREHVMVSWWILMGCGEPLSVPCADDGICVRAFGEGSTCQSDGLCRRVRAPTGETGDAGPIALPPEDLVINEVLYDPSNAPAEADGSLPGDANGDGVYVHNLDEFVELVNIGSEPLDVSGFQLYDDEAWLGGRPRHTIAQGTVIGPGMALVVFGGGDPTGEFGGSIVQTADDGEINLNNDRDALHVATPDGFEFLTFDVTSRANNPNESYTRVPDLYGETFQQHGSATPRLFSPGTRRDGTPFVSTAP